MRQLMARATVLMSILAFALAGAGCARGVQSARTPEPEAGQVAPAHSGFLSDYSRLRADPADPNLMQYTAPGVGRKYHKFMIDTPEFIINTGGLDQVLDPARMSEIAKNYRAAMIAALSQHYQVVNHPGPGVARLRLAVVGAVEVNERLKPINALPVSALFKVARAATGTNAQVLRMSIESEAIDSVTGALLGETVDSRESSKTVVKGNPADSDQLNQLIDFWVRRFVGRLDAANGFAPSGSN